MTASTFIRENFELTDRLAVVCLNKRTHQVIQRLAPAESIAAADFQAWLRYRNNEGFEIYLSMNALKDSANGRTKSDIGKVRHVYLDFDEDGTASVEHLLKRNDVPTPNYVVNTSPDKWQVLWKVEGFEIDPAEHVQKALARQTAADMAATDCARVLRLPGFYNHKYAQRFRVGVEKFSDEIYGVERFPKLSEEDRNRPPGGTHPRPQKNPAGPLSQSERDWAFAKRSLARGDSHENVVAAITTYRRFDKPNPRYYAERTVQKAAESLAADRDAEPER